MKQWFKPFLSLAVVASILTGCATPNAVVEIHGEVWYKERMMLPEDAVITVQVQDVSLADAPAEVIAEFERNDVSTPVPFQFLINRDQFEPGHTYNIGARITYNGELMFINTQAYRIDLDSIEPMSVLVQKVAR
ncbi:MULTISPECIES: YbaY family lipoprotein [Shewanella]|uniref:YbaY family lipoprotein n=1 Tax=Shewanella fidelis TaxID=173509 RepID=A0AAW8NKF9_9GAMM|nr:MULTISPECIES: YbaY family lipoprotein [Shewanella]MDR8523156.1 YbaY family lipoprotein [Shewanella fidelis]MDW4811518.1 YbaY family lipoprotein [Shewanella fidelis]MDW4815639.1 YbaY family lipoprotein [Shewanella fidelis]MDW4819729.1 YbaY family lipoprotein [Shewanella fidelis]MDW4824297.1 YbaY family lipoprotein [Shewanella fidelis]